MRDTRRLNICSWNATGIMSSLVYMHKVLTTRDIQICGLSEHWLFRHNEHFLGHIHADYQYYSKCSNDLCIPNPQRKVGKAGVAILYHKNLASQIKLLEVDTDRVIGIQLQLKSTYMFIFQVYLPTTSYSIDTFTQYVDLISDLYASYSQHGEVLIMGDFNTELNGNDARSRQFLNMLATHQSTAVTKTSLRTGADVSYVPFNGGEGSLIDHFAMPTDKMNQVVLCEVAIDTALNVSNHRPILLILKFDSNCDGIRNKAGAYNWKKLSNDDIQSTYTQMVDETLQRQNAHNNANPHDNLSIYQNIASTLLACSEATIPRRSYRPHLKPFWNTDIDDAHREMLQKRHVWIQQGRPRSIFDESYLNYKNSKCVFRRLLRNASYKYLQKLNDDIDSAAAIDQTAFWKLVNARSSKTTKPMGGELIFNGQSYRDDAEMANQWGMYFEELYKPDDNGQFDEDHRLYITREVVSYMQRNDSDENTAITWKISDVEICDAIRGLSKAKAAGADGVANEHIMHGGEQLVMSLCILFNSLMEQEHIPQEMKKGITVTLHKGNGKSTILIQITTER